LIGPIPRARSLSRSLKFHFSLVVQGRDGPNTFGQWIRSRSRSTKWSHPDLQSGCSPVRCDADVVIIRLQFPLRVPVDDQRCLTTGGCTLDGQPHIPPSLVELYVVRAARQNAAIGITCSARSHLSSSTGVRVVESNSRSTDHSQTQNLSELTEFRYRCEVGLGQGGGYT
jgi:hypothetical protein